MATGVNGTFVIDWLQTEVDGLTGNSIESLEVGSTWRWHGTAVRVDAHHDVLVLENAENVVALRQRAAAQVTRMLSSPKFARPDVTGIDPDESLFSTGFDLTDGLKRYQATVVDAELRAYPMLLFVGEMPPADRDLWVVSHQMPNLPNPTQTRPGGVVCFVPGTQIDVPGGTKSVEDLQPGDLVSTKDNGSQEILWVGQRHISGARLAALPELRPIRLRAGVMGQGRTDADLLVSPEHRVVLQGPSAMALFNTPEVLVAARDLICDRTIVVDNTLRDVRYIHLMLGKHQILRANGVDCESFHPANAALDQIETGQFQAMLQQFPCVAEDPFHYGAFARRNLTRAEAAILTYRR